MDHLCNRNSGWTILQSWNATDPVFDSCFENIIFTVSPCFVFWILGLAEIPVIVKKKPPPIIHHKLMTAKMIICGCLLVLSVTEFICIVGQFGFSREPIDYFTVIIVIMTYGLSAVLLYFEMKRGMYATWSQFLFWTLFAVAEIMKFISLMMQKHSKISTIGITVYVLKMLQMPFVIIAFLMVCLSDNIILSLTSTTNYELSEFSERLSSIPGKITYHWINPLIMKIFYQNVEAKNLWDLDTPFKSHLLGNLFEVEVKMQRFNGQRKLLKILMRHYLWEFVVSIIIFISSESGRYLAIYLQTCLIYSVMNDEPKWHGYFFAFTLSVANAYGMTVYSYCVHLQQMLSMKITSGLMSTIFRKAMRLSNESRKSVAIGEITNLMSVDTQRLIDASFLSCRFYGAPFVVAVGILLAWKEFGPASLVLLFIWLALVVFYSFLTKLQRRQYRKTALLKDQRINLMNEILRGMKSLKVNAWEKCFKNEVEKIRKEELRNLLKSSWVETISSTAWSASKNFVILAVFGTYCLLNPNGILRADSAFAVFGILINFQNSLNDVATYLPHALQLDMSLKRIEKFLYLDDLETKSQLLNLECTLKDNMVLVENGYFKWTKSCRATLRSINLRISGNMLITVIGQVGSGKSSLLSAIMGEMIAERGTTVAQGPFGYVAQHGWLQNATIKSNILFGKPYDEQYYKQVVDACALISDFETFPEKDDTEIGERGITLSGGQILRVSLARAVYSRANIYLLDDPLSALDAFVGKRIFDLVIGPRGILNSSVRIFCTHITTYLSSSDEIVVLNDGEIIFQGTYLELSNQKNPTSLLPGSFVAHHRTSETITEFTNQKNFHVGDKGESSKLIMPEERRIGSVWAVVFYYIKAMQSHIVILFIACYFIMMYFGVVGDYWLSDWTNDERQSDAELYRQQRIYRMNVYAAFGLGYTIFSFVASVALQYGFYNASKSLHRKMLDNVFHLPMSFFETTPKGRVLNRFSRDIDVMDMGISKAFIPLYRLGQRFIVSLVILSISLPWFLLGVVVLLILFIIVQRIYVRVSRRLNTLEAVTRSPVFAMFIEALAGCETIRAFNRQQEFCKALDELIDVNRRCYIPLLVVGTWLQSHYVVLSSILMLLIGVLCTALRNSLSAGLIGLLISSGLSFVNPLGGTAYCMAHLEINVTSLERIKDYSEVQREADCEKRPNCPAVEWPTDGDIVFRNYSTRYRKELDLTLKNVFCHVNGGEKIGIVGRTGAGKSSLAMALFRIIEADEGSICIDGIDISTIALEDLRSRITIIPQDPVLFSGTIRFNLDPTRKHSDDELYEALESSSLKKFVEGLEGGLQYELSEGGGNLSAGQRQLMCLARAILRNTKIVVLDEATASVDFQTDHIVQRVIRTKFSHCTLLVIAHRISTILDSDRVMVIHNKAIVEFDSPQVLLNDQSSVFYKIVKDTGSLPPIV